MSTACNAVADVCRRWTFQSRLRQSSSCSVCRFSFLSRSNLMNALSGTDNEHASFSSSHWSTRQTHLLFFFHLPLPFFSINLFLLLLRLLFPIASLPVFSLIRRKWLPLLRSKAEKKREREREGNHWIGLVFVGCVWAYSWTSTSRHQLENAPLFDARWKENILTTALIHLRLALWNLRIHL